MDDVINVSGHRLGTAEVESALVLHDAVAEAAVVGFPHEVKGTGIYAYCILNDGFEDSEDLRRELGPLVKASGEMADLVAFSLLEHSVFHLRRGNAPCADSALEMLEGVAGKSGIIDKLRSRSRGLYLRADSTGILTPSPYREMPFP